RQVRKMPQQESPSRILIVRLSAVGDVIHGMPVACALRDAFPDAFLAWIVEGRNGDLIEGHPAVDQVIRVPRRWLKSAREVLAIRQRLHRLRFDVTVDLQCLTKSAVVAWLSGAPRRIGVAGADGRELSKWLNNELTRVDAAHVVDHYLGILAPLGVAKPEVRFDLPEQACDAKFANETLEKLGLRENRFAVLNPGAGWPSKLWPADRYGDVAAHLRDLHELPSLVVWSGDQELRWARRIVNCSGGGAFAAPATSLRQLAALLRRAALFLGSDTGPMHLAVAAGTPTISMHGASRAEWCGAYGAENIRLQARYAGGTARQRRNADNDAMRAVTVDMAANACDELLNSALPRRCA
ncbi:MAG: glycosyltransferase family 9 protein, partial [Planctomycetota bacterium]